VAASRWALQWDGNDRPLAILEINNDITEHKQLKLREHEARRQLRATLKALRESEARFKRLADVNIIGVVAADFSGNITEANEAFLQTVGYTREELLWVDLHWDEITPPEYRPLDGQAIEQLRRSGVCTPYEKEYIRKDGSRVPVLVGAVLSGESQDSGIAFVLDLSKRGQAGKVLSEDGEAKSRPMSYTLYEEIQEDLVEALQAMESGQVELEELRPDAHLGQRLLSREVDALRLAADALRKALSDLRLKRLERGRSFVRVAQPLAQDQPFLQAVEFLVELNRQIVPGREIQLTVEDKFPSEIPVLTRLELLTILKEALVNARRHSEARCIRVALGVGEDKYWAEVADDGQGFDTRTPEEGAGIAEMRESAYALGGELEVDSEPGRGTRVRVWVPF
jgi:PAS domain S-box-containing protein